MKSAIVAANNVLSDSHLGALVKLHREELKGGFLSSLGDRALSLMFRFAASSDTSVLLIAISPTLDLPVGFLLGTYDTKRFYQAFIRSQFFNAVWILAPKLLSPRRVVRLIETLLYPQRHLTDALPRAELLDVVVGSKFQGEGTGEALFEKFRELLRQKGVDRFRVTTGESLTSAHRFYARMGAVHVSNIEVHSGGSTRVYVCQTGD